jgi:hypothetical protein
MARTLAVNANNDLFIGRDGNISINVGIDAVKDACSQAAKTLLGEMVLRVNDGIPYDQAVWSGVPNIPVFVAALRTALLGVVDVTDVESLDVIQQADVLQYTAVINTVYGQTILTQGVPFSG